jgi:EmrB/QacA subfamily drug resistance transporter
VAAVRAPEQHRNWVLVATILGSSMVFINGSTVNVALPALQNSLNASVADMQWIINSYTLFLASLILLGGSLGDHYGRKRIFMIGVVVFALASVWCAVVPNVTWLIIARAAQGIGGALLTPGSLAIISATFRDEERGRAIGLWAGFSALTSAIGPLLGGWLIDSFSWRWIFLIHIPLAMIVLVISFLFVPESRDEEAPSNLDWWGSLLVTLGLGGVTFGLISASERGLDNGLVWGALLAGGVLLGVFVWWEARNPEPMIPLSLFRSRNFSGANLLTLFLYIALSGALFFLPLNLIQVQGYSATQAGAAFLPMILIMSLLSSWTGGLVNRVGARLLLVVGPVIAGVGFFLLGLPGEGGSYWITYFPAMVVIGLGMAVSVAPLTTTVMDSVADHFAGTASGVNNAVSRVASLLAIALLGIVMVQVFSNSLEGSLSALALPAGTQDAIISQQTSLAAIEVPAGLDENSAEALNGTVTDAFMVGFRVVSFVSAGLALISALIAGIMIADKPKAEVRPALAPE